MDKYLDSSNNDYISIRFCFEMLTEYIYTITKTKTRPQTDPSEPSIVNYKKKLCSHFRNKFYIRK